ncbi:MAG TPA: hypothetical protein VHZ31_09305, partial [Solirubrobacteraceae bacterium]|nr:hypothetical protein [Solirubrobacteraceae bacterium]
MTRNMKTRQCSDLALLAAATLSLSACGLLLGVPGDFSNCQGGPLDVDVPCGGGGSAPTTSSEGGTTSSTTPTGSGGAGGATLHCTNGVRDDGETDVDCGGACGACADGDGCETGADCTSKSCTHGTCATATCTDGLTNGDETDVDCGGPGACPRCAVGTACAGNSDCDGTGAGRCVGGVCSATCTDGLMNGDETDIDCGGSCSGCPAGMACTASADCEGKACIGNLCGTASVSVGAQTTCAVGVSGLGVCWGYNGDGERGDGNQLATAGASIVSNLMAITSISVGNASACALTATGDVWCWGTGSQGQLGTGSVASSDVPVHLDTLGAGNRAVSVSVGHACVITNVGGAMCWGSNGHGELGDGTATTRLTPVQVAGLASGVARIAAGYFFTCAVLTSGAVKCWGDNEYGQLGNGTTANSATPVSVAAFTFVDAPSSITVGADFACAIAPGVGDCWGHNNDGELGDGTTTD